ncbi:MAG: 30S ribosomal protein S20 [Desulfatiglandaceae bacterium]
MANHKSALKRARQSEVRRLRNKAYKTKVRTAVKMVRGATPEKAAEQLSATISVIQKTASRGVIHRNQAARKISRLTRLVNHMQAS